MFTLADSIQGKQDITQEKVVSSQHIETAAFPELRPRRWVSSLSLAGDWPCPVNFDYQRYQSSSNA